MKQYLPKISALTSLLLLLQYTGFTQESSSNSVIERDTLRRNKNESYEVIIKSRSDKDTKVMVEIKNGEVLVDGKPLSEYNNGNLSVRKRKTMTSRGGKILMDGDDGPDLAFMAPEPGVEGKGFQYSPYNVFRDQGDMNFSGDDGPARSKRGFLGVTSEKPDDAEGAKVTQITKGSGADKAGLHIGDLITKVGETAVSGPESLSGAIRKYKPEDKVALTIKREGKEQKITATLGKSKLATFNLQYDNYPKMPDFNFDNITPPPGQYRLTLNMKPKLGIKAQDTEDGKGVKVLEIDEESAADKAGIKEGDIITKFDGKEVNSAADLAQGARAAKEKSSFRINLLREGKAQEVEVKIPKKLRTADL